MDEIKNIAFNAEMSERVDRFLHKEMSEAESKAFIDEVKTNPELKEYYQRQFNLMRGIQFQQIRKMMEAKEAELSTRSTPAPWWKSIFAPSEETSVGPAQASKSGGTVVLKRLGYVYATVAVAAAMVCGLFIWDGNVTKRVGDQMYSQVIRGGEDSIDQLVDEGKYAEALKAIDKQLSIEVEFVDSASAAAYEQDMNALRYRKALVYLKMGKKHQAKKILKKLNDPQSKKVLDELLW